MTGGFDVDGSVVKLSYVAAEVVVAVVAESKFAVHAAPNAS